MKSSCRVRLLAIEALVPIVQGEKRADEMLAIKLPLLELDADKRFLHTLIYGVLRHYYTLEVDISRFMRSKKPDDSVRMALLLGALQLRHLHTADHAAISETVEATKQLQPRAAPLVNAILRKLTQTPAPEKFKPYQRLELPRWIYRSWRDCWGIEALETFAPLFKTPAPLCLAILGDTQQWQQDALQLDINATLGELSPHAVLLPTATAVGSLPGFADGYIMVMDQAAQASVRLLSESLPQNENIQLLDLCASPGGKTALLAHLLPDATITAVEHSSRRLPRLQENLARLNLPQQPNIIQGDACSLPLPDHCMDAIFLDAPCTASGIMRKHPDVRFSHDETQLLRLAAQQEQMMQEAVRVLKPGGNMVYAVCSIHPQEHQAGQGSTLSIQQELRLFPTATSDGFYAVLLHKEKA